MNFARAFVTALLAAMGVVFTHGFGYVLSYPDTTARSEALAGHKHLDMLGPGFVMAGVAMAVLLVVLGVSAPQLARRMHLSWRVLAISQLVGFVGLEVLERLDTLDQVMNEPALVAGALLQAPAAWILLRCMKAGALLVGGIALTAPPTRPSVAGRLVVSRSISFRTGSVRHSPISRRGPPSHLV